MMTIYSNIYDLQYVRSRNTIEMVGERKQKRRRLSDPTPGVWGRPRGTSAGLYRGLPYKPGHAYETNPRHRRGNRGSERRVREAEEDTREAEEDKE